MPTLEQIQGYFGDQAVQTSPALFVFQLLVAALLCSLLSRFYVLFGRAASNRQSFARVFVPLGLVTTLVVAVIKTSLALSLGMVGALSIVRFRGAIKDPEELTYVFACIGVGLGVAADQTVVTTLCVGALLLATYLYHRRGEPVDASMLLIVSSEAPAEADCDRFLEILRRHCPEVHLRRLEVEEARAEASFSLPGVDYAALRTVQTELRALSPTVKVCALDNEGVF